MTDKGLLQRQQSLFCCLTSDKLLYLFFSSGNRV